MLTTLAPVVPDRGLAFPSRPSVHALLALALLPPAIAAFVLWGADIPGLTADRTALAARDFTVLWAAGRLAAAHTLDLLADPAALTGFIRDTFGAGMPAQIWPYPPTALLLAVPISRLPLGLGLMLYSVATPLLLLAALRLGRLNWPVCIAVAVSPAVLDSALAGQNGALTAALLLAGLLTLHRRPVLAGALLGLLVIKPQLAIVIPFCLVAGRQWRPLLAAAASSAACMLLSALVFGLDAWADYLLRTPAFISTYLEAPWHAGPEQLIFASAFMAARSLGAGLDLAYLLQTATILLCAGLSWRVWRSQAFEPERRAAATVGLAMLACPWIHSYDMPALAAAIAILYPRTPRTARPLLGWAWLWPGLLTLLPVPNVLSFMTVGSIAWLACRKPRP